MGIFRRGDSLFWWYRVQLDGRVATGSTNTGDKKLAHRIYMEKHHQFTAEHHLPNQRGKGTSFFMNIQPESLEGFKAHRKNFVKDATINRELAVLKTIFTKAIKWGYASRNPVKEVSLFKEERTPIRILTVEERAKLLSASHELLRPILLMALKTGMRQGEILNLQWKNVDLESETISITQTKAMKLRQIPIHPELKEFLAKLPRPTPFVFASKFGTKYHPYGMIREWFVKLRVQLGMPDLTFHMLRHNFASELIAKGADVRTVQEYMGHSSLRMLQRYAHVNKGIWRSTIQLLGRDSASANTTLALRTKNNAVAEVSWI